MSNTFTSSFMDEISKIAKKDESTWSKIKSFVGKHKGKLALGLGAAAGGGMMGRHFLKKPAPVTGPINATLRRKAKKGGIHYRTRTSAKVGGKPSLWERIKANVRLGGAAKPIYTDRKETPLNPKAKAPKGITVGVEPLKGGSSQAEVSFGGIALKKNKVPKSLKPGMKLWDGGKMLEASKSTGISSLMAKGTDIHSLARKAGIKPPSKGASMDDHASFLRSIQRQGQKDFKAGFVAKPHSMPAQSGYFPGEKGDWGTVYKDYQKRLKGKMDKYLVDARKQGSTATDQILLRDKFKDDPAYIGKTLSSFTKEPKLSRVEERMTLNKTLIGKKPAEFRVHVIGGKKGFEVPDDLAFTRYSPTTAIAEKIPGIKQILRAAGGKHRGSPKEAVEFVRKEVLPKLNKKYKGTSFGMDIASVKNKDGSQGWRVIELNPHTPSSMTKERGVSGVMTSAKANPIGPFAMKKWITGKDAGAIAGLKAGTVGTAAGLAAFGAGAVIGKKKEKK